jgi:hypothetical protein
MSSIEMEEILNRLQAEVQRTIGRLHEIAYEIDCWRLEQRKESERLMTSAKIKLAERL